MPEGICIYLSFLLLIISAPANTKARGRLYGLESYGNDSGSPRNVERRSAVTRQDMQCEGFATVVKKRQQTML